MNILVISAADPDNSAGIVALDLCSALRKINGYKVTLLIKNYTHCADSSIISYNNRFIHYSNIVSKLVNRIFIKLRFVKSNTVKSNIDYSFLEYDLSTNYVNTKRLIRKVESSVDIIIVLFMQHFLSYKVLYELSQVYNSPILLYMMDMEVITGGCHSAWNCLEYKAQCGKCPALYSNYEQDQSRINWLYKKKYIDLTNLVAIACSGRQYEQLQASSLFMNVSKKKVFLSIHPENFKPADKIIARSTLGLPVDKRILLFGTVGVHNRKKGFNELMEAIVCLHRRDTISNIHIAIVGRVRDDYQYDIPYKYSMLGYLSHDKIILAFQSADVFLCPSIEDSGPMMINQAMMCGIPVVSFDMGVAIDLILTGKTGYRAKLRDTTDFAKGIESILSQSETEYSDMSNNCRELALDLCHPLVQATQFSQIIDEIT